MVKVKGFGWRKEPTDIRDLEISDKHFKGLKKAGTGTLPKSVDLTKYCSPIVDQGDLGSCTANAAAGMIAFMEKWKNNKYIEASRLFIYKTTRLLMGQEGIGDSGAYIRTTLKALALFGAPPEDLVPYNIKKFDIDPTSFAYQFASNYQALKYIKVDSSKDQNTNLTNTKKMLSLGYPVQIGFNVYESYQDTNEGFPYPSIKENIVGGHSVLIVGYNDDISLKNPIDNNEKQGVFKIRNSWGTQWGVNNTGYGYLPYQYLLDQLADDFWTVQKQEWVDLSQFD